MSDTTLTPTLSIHKSDSFSQRFRAFLNPPPALNAPPDQGYAWVVMVASFIVHLFALGVTYIFGVYGLLYAKDPAFIGISTVEISLIGSLTAAGMPLFAIPAGLAADLIGYRLVGILGGIGFIVSFVLAGLSTQYWQLLLTQGLLLGASISFCYVPSLSILSHWFVEKKGLATGMAVAGAGVGGLVLAPVSQILVDKFGRSTTLIFTGIVSGVMIILASSVLVPRLEPSKTKPRYFEMMKNVKFQFLYLLAFIGNFGYFIPFFYLPSYAVSKGLSDSQGAILIGILNGSSAVGRIILGVTADKIGHVNALLLCQTFSTISLLVIWPLSSTFATLLIFSVIFGLCVGGFVSILPSVIVQLFGLNNISAIIGLVYSSSFFGTIGGPFVAAILIQMATTEVAGVKSVNYIPAIMFSGTCFGVASLLILALAIVVNRGALRQRAVEMESLQAEEVSLKDGPTVGTIVVLKEESA